MNRFVEAEIVNLSRRQSALRAAQEPSAGLTRLREAQAEYDGTFRALGTAGAPAPESGESEKSYRGRLAGALLPHTATFCDTDPYVVAGLPEMAQRLRDEVVARVNDPHGGPLRKVIVRDAESAVERVEWHGAECPLPAMFSPPYQVALSESPLPPVLRHGTPVR